MDLTAALLIAGAYLWGAVPVSYLVARYRKGIDIRDYGSGNVGATNLMTHVGPWTGFLAGVFDCLAKGTLPVLIAREVLGLPVSLQVAAGLAAIAGHSWSPYLLFTGGRGVATAIGVILSFFWSPWMLWQEMLIIGVILGTGRVVFHETGLWTFVSLLVLPVLAWIFGEKPEVVTMTLGIGALLMAKRLTANWERPDPGYPVVRVLAYRALWDRDVPRKQQWTGRQPAGDQESTADV